MLDVEKLIAGVHDYIGRALAPFAVRVKALEDRVPERGEKGDAGPAGERGADGLPGKSAYLLAVERGFTGTELQWLDSLAGKPGRDGINGKDAIPVDVEAVAREAAALVPVPKDGKPGPAGKDIDPAMLNDAINRKVADAVSKLPAPKDVDPAVIAQMVSEGVAQALPGAAQRAIDALMPELIAKAADAVPRPRDGKDADPETIRSDVSNHFNAMASYFVKGLDDATA